MKEQEFKRPSLRYRRRHLLRSLFNGWPWIVWLVAALMVLVLLPGGWHRVRFYGEAERTYECVAPLVDGRLSTLHVGVGDRVEKGDPIGELDSASLDADLLMDQASLMKTHDRIQAIRCDVRDAELEEAKTEAQLKALQARRRHNEELLRKKLVLEQDVEDLAPQIEATKEFLARYPKLIEGLSNRLAVAERSATLFDPERLKALRGAQCRLSASSSGVVSEVLHRPGDIVRKGDPVVRIGNVATDRIIAFLPAGTRVDASPGKSCKVISTYTREARSATVESVTTDIRKLPTFTGFADRVQRGRRVVIKLDDGETITPGERVVVVPELSIFDQWFGRKRR